MSDILAQPLRPSDQSLQTMVGEETVIMHVGTGKYFSLDEVGSRIWALLGHNVAPSRLSAMLADEYDVSEEAIGADVSRFLTQLYEHDLLVAG